MIQQKIYVRHFGRAYLRPVMERMAAAAGVQLIFVAEEGRADIVVLDHQLSKTSPGRRYLVVQLDVSGSQSAPDNVHFIHSGSFGQEFQKFLTRLKQGQLPQAGIST